MQKKYKHLIVLAAPSGAGKTTIAHRLLKEFPMMRFSISATTRPKRPKEQDSIDYYFMTKDEFQQKIENNELAEYEEIFGNFYGTLRSEIDKAKKQNKLLLFDIDVKGALSLRKAYPEDTLLIFISPPTIEELEKRLRLRNTENQEQIDNRLARVEMELKLKDKFDYVIINDVLEEAIKKTIEIVKENTGVINE